ncbi:MAG: serine/threonine-protein kinase [Myxococcota bacterium]
MTEAASGPGVLAPGTRLGRYQVLRRLALGGMAELYLARQLGDAGYEKVVALKRVLPHLAEEKSFVDMFLNEARLAATLSHSGIAAVHDFGTEHGEHFMVLEYVHGRSVLQLLKAARGPLPLGVALTIVHEVAGALHYAHERCGSDGAPLGLVHRDVSPSNILVSFDGDVKLVDFGIAKATAHNQATQTAGIKGKIAYMAPEQLRGEPLDRRSDVFALSVVLYELVLGRRCFSAPGEFALINRVAEARYTKPSRIDPNIHPDLATLLTTGLDAQPDGRPATARDVQLRIEAFAEAHAQRLSRVAVAHYMEASFGFEAYPQTSAIPLPAVEAAEVPVPPPARRSLVPWLGVAAVLLVGVGVGVMLQAPQEAEGEVAPAAIAAPAAPSPRPAAEPEPAVEEVVALEPEPTASDVAPSPPQPATHKRKRKKKKRRKGKASGSAPDAAAGLAADYLPPSRRPG